MNRQTERLRREFEDVVRRGKALAAGFDDATLMRRPAERSWSRAECLEHLSATAEEYARRIRAALDRAGHTTPRPRERMSLFGWLFLRFMEPPVRKKLRVPNRVFKPGAVTTREALLARFEEQHATLIALLEESDTRDRRRLRVPDPVGKFTIPLYDTFAILAAHGRRHLWQAERIRAQGAGGRAREKAE